MYVFSLKIEKILMLIVLGSCILFASGSTILPQREKTVKVQNKQKEKKFSLNIKILDINHKAVESVVVSVEPYGVWGVTNNDGVAEIKNIPLDSLASYQLSINALGYKSLVIKFIPQANKIQQLEFIIEEESMALNEVVVVAENRKSGESTASIIGRQAIDHLQATSLKDLLQLIPGQVSMKNPSLSGAEYFNSRSLNSSNFDSFGSTIIIDGVPISTNANMGVNLTKLGSGDRGVDLRSIGTDNIESVEVIRGIASAQYGDVSSGMMIINSKIGVTDFNMEVKIMPGITQFYVGKGFKVGNIGNINISADYARGRSDPRFRTDIYDRVLASVAHSKDFKGKWIITTELNMSSIKDWSGADPDEPVALQKYFRESKELNFRISHSGKINLNKLFARTIKYDFAFSNNMNNLKSLSLIPVGGGAILDAINEDGPIKGNLGFKGMFEGIPYPMSYETFTGIKSNPINWYAKISDYFQLKAGKLRNRFNIGAEFRSEGNEGYGKYDASEEYPAFAEARIRHFRDIPYLTQFSLYAEDNFNLAFCKDSYPSIKGQVGVRWSIIQPGKNESMNSLSPRLNLSLNLAEWVSLRFGFGFSDKMPSLLYLYPENVYYDFYNLSASNGTDRYYLYSTRIFNPTNHALKPMRNTKWETGFDIKLKNEMVFSVVGYWEKVKNGFTLDNSKWVSLQFPKWESKDILFNGHHPEYDVDNPSKIENVLFNIIQPSNKGCQKNSGLEFDFNLGKIRATNTSFYLNGAYSVSKYYSATHTFSRAIGESKTYSDVYLVYESSSSVTSQVSAAMRVVQHIPVISFIVSATAQFIFYDCNYETDISDRPLGYISPDGNFSDGCGGVKYTLFTQEQFNDPEYKFADSRFILKDQHDLHSSLDLPTKWPMVWCLNLRVTKEIGTFMGFSFYVNNMLFYQPWQTSSNASNPVERNSSLFSYGLEISLKF